MKDFVDNIKSFYAHEHLGSTNTMGYKGQFFNCDKIKGYSKSCGTDIFDLIYSPYLGGNIFQSDKNPPKFDDDFSRFSHSLSVMKKFKNRGVVRALNIAFLDLYGTSLWDMEENEQAFCAVNKAIKQKYENYYRWYGEVFEKMNCEKIVRTIHPHYMVNNGENARIEQEYVLPLVRVDSVIGYLEGEELNLSYFEELSGVSPKNVHEFEKNIDFLFDVVDKNHVIGLKHFQAYMRTLENKIVSRVQAKEALESKNYIALQDYLLHCIYKKANERGMIFQIHTGMTNLKNSNPTLLELLFSMYPNIKFVLLHCYPFTKEAAYLASVYKNVYLDTSWLALQSEAMLENALKEYISIVPISKIMLSCDATNLEEFYGADKLTRLAVKNLIVYLEQKGYIEKSDEKPLAEMLLYKNSFEFYNNIGNIVK